MAAIHSSGAGIADIRNKPGLNWPKQISAGVWDTYTLTRNEYGRDLSRRYN
jgi:hypothetical protein